MIPLCIDVGLPARLTLYCLHVLSYRLCVPHLLTTCNVFIFIVGVKLEA